MTWIAEVGYFASYAAGAVLLHSAWAEYDVPYEVILAQCGMLGTASLVHRICARDPWPLLGPVWNVGSDQVRATHARILDGLSSRSRVGATFAATLGLITAYWSWQLAGAALLAAVWLGLRARWAKRSIASEQPTTEDATSLGEVWDELHATRWADAVTIAFAVVLVTMPSIDTLIAVATPSAFTWPILIGLVSRPIGGWSLRVLREEAAVDYGLTSQHVTTATQQQGRFFFLAVAGP
jgi:hypothetical protein